MQQTNYSKKLLDHYHNPRNFGKLNTATHEAEGTNSLCGDEIKVYLRMEDGRIHDMKYEARGCALMVASASVVSERIKKQESRSKHDIEKIFEIKVSPARESCIMLALDTIKKALLN